jgi:protocatechuate 3,4-dioxygenase beta subunit
VLDAAGRPVAGALIWLWALASETPAGWLRAITDAAGNFRIGGLVPGFYALLAFDDLQNSVQRHLPLLADATARIQLVLDRPITI